jgi:hypothetical protein
MGIGALLCLLGMVEHMCEEMVCAKKTDAPSLKSAPTDRGAVKDGTTIEP